MRLLTPIKTSLLNLPHESSFDKEAVEITEKKLLKCNSESLRTSLARTSKRANSHNHLSIQQQMRIMSIEKTSRVAFPKKKKIFYSSVSVSLIPLPSEEETLLEREKRQAHDSW